MSTENSPYERAQLRGFVVLTTGFQEVKVAAQELSSAYANAADWARTRSAALQERIVRGTVSAKSATALTAERKGWAKDWEAPRVK